MKMGLIALVVALASTGCGGSSGSYSNMSGPTGSSGAGVTVDILPSNGLANLGAASFSPNPASVAQGTTVSWQNNDSTTHHIVLDNGSLDTGTIAPGATSPAMTLNASGATYHCTIHPSMVGSINVAASAAPGSTYSLKR